MVIYLISAGGNKELLKDIYCTLFIGLMALDYFCIKLPPSEINIHGFLGCPHLYSELL